MTFFLEPTEHSTSLHNTMYSGNILPGTRYKNFLVHKKHWYLEPGTSSFCDYFSLCFQILITCCFYQYYCSYWYFSAAALLPGTRLITIKRPLTIKMPGLVKTVSASALIETMTSSQLLSPNNEQETQSESAIVAQPASTTIDESNTEGPQPLTSQPDEPLSNSAYVSYPL